MVTSHTRRTRIPLRLWLVSGDALGEWDGGTIGVNKDQSNVRATSAPRTVGKLLMPDGKTMTKRGEIDEFASTVNC